METSPAVVEADLSCAICGYNLKGLAVNGQCPECGQAIARSYRPDLPRSDPAWLRHQANTMLLLGALCLANFQPVRYSYRAYQAWMVLSILLSLGAIWACWRLARPEPPGPPADGEATLQRALRLAPIVFAAVQIGTLVSGKLSLPLTSVLGVAEVVCLLITNALVAWFVLRLARRTNDPKLILHARIVLWAFPLSQAGDVLLFFTSFVIGRDELGVILFGNVLGVFRFLLGVAVYITLLLLGRMHETLRSAAKESEMRLVVQQA